MVSPLGLVPFIERETEPFFKVRSTVTFFNGVGAMHLWEKHYGIPINGFSPNGLINIYFNKFNCQSTERVFYELSIH
jgi:hypothetical protein